MKNKGFTFVELLVVMVLLGIIVLVVLPSITGLLKQSDNNKQKAFENDVFLATEAYIQKNINKYPQLNYDNGIAYVYLNELVSSKYLRSDLVNPSYCDDNDNCDSKPISICDESGNCTVDDYTVKATRTEDGYVYKLYNGIIYEEYKEEILNGADPVLSGNLIPVMIANDGTVTKADTYSGWYNYENKRWANAVILKDETITYENFEEIPESNIESYFVWIPRYRYQIFDEGNYDSYISDVPTESKAQTINIVFESKDTAASTGTTLDSWLTHPAFTTFDTNGIWVGKFETGYDGATSTKTALVSSTDSTKIIVKPNTYSWTGNKVSNIFAAAYNYNRNLNSHMMKNTEWGAVAYLSHSIYGINKEVNINNNSNYFTGYSAVEGTDQTDYPGTCGTDSSVTLAYNTTTGYKASTTGNISGVYDMSGGSWEYMASYRAETYGNSGFDATTIAEYDTKYFDIYPSDSTYISYTYRILGDATGEMGPFYYYADGDGTVRYHNSWYADNSYFVSSSTPWFNRGSNFYDGVLASQFNFSLGTGAAHGSGGSRLVLTN